MRESPRTLPYALAVDRACKDAAKDGRAPDKSSAIDIAKYACGHVCDQCKRALLIHADFTVKTARHTCPECHYVQGCPRSA